MQRTQLQVKEIGLELDVCYAAETWAEGRKILSIMEKKRFCLLGVTISRTEKKDRP